MKICFTFLTEERTVSDLYGNFEIKEFSFLLEVNSITTVKTKIKFCSMLFS